MIRTIQTELAPKPKGPYSQGVVCKNGMVYISAQGPIEAGTGRFVDGDFKSQVVLVFANISNILKQTGLNLKDVVKVTVYLSDYRYFEELNEVYREIFSEPFPARTPVKTDVPFGLIMADVVALKDN